MKKLLLVAVMLFVIAPGGLSYAACLDQFVFKATKNAYWETGDVVNACQNEFGPNYRLADWNDIIWFKNSGGTLDAFFIEIGMAPYNVANYGNYYQSNSYTKDSFLVSMNGQRFWNGGNRHFFIQRHDHIRPSDWAIHGTIDNNLIDLGSWYSIYFRVVCFKIN